jgi:hypothetical protein
MISNIMEHFRVIVKVRKLNGFDAFELLEYYPVYANTAEDAAASIVGEKKVNKEDIVSVNYEHMY